MPREDAVREDLAHGKKAYGVDVTDPARAIVVKAEKHATKTLGGLPLYELTVEQCPKDTNVTPPFNPRGDRADDLALHLDGYRDAEGAWQSASDRHRFARWVDDPPRNPPVTGHKDMLPGMAIDVEEVWGLEVPGDHPGTVKVKQVEALWTKDGAYCLDKTRLEECRQWLPGKCPGYQDGAGPIILMNLMRRQEGKDPGTAADAVCPE